MNHWALRSEAFHQGWQNERKKHRKNNKWGKGT